MNTCITMPADVCIYMCADACFYLNINVCAFVVADVELQVNQLIFQISTFCSRGVPNFVFESEPIHGAHSLLSVAQALETKLYCHLFVRPARRT